MKEKLLTLFSNDQWTPAPGVAMIRGLLKMDISEVVCNSDKPQPASAVVNMIEDQFAKLPVSFNRDLEYRHLIRSLRAAQDAPCMALTIRANRFGSAIILLGANFDFYYGCLTFAGSQEERTAQ